MARRCDVVYVGVIAVVGVFCVFSIRKNLSMVLIGVIALSVSGCSSKQGTGAGRVATAESSPGEGRGRVLTSEELKASALTLSEVPKASSVPVRDPAPEGNLRTFPPVSDASCQTMLDSENVKGASAVVYQTFNWEGDVWGGGSTLSSYEGGGAEQEFRRLQKALKSCKSYSGASFVGKYTSEIKVEQAPRVGDEALAFRAVTPVDSGGASEMRIGNTEVVFVRTGSVVVVFHKLEYGRDAKFPRELIKKQVERLAKAQKS